MRLSAKVKSGGLSGRLVVLMVFSAACSFEGVASKVFDAKAGVPKVAKAHNSPMPKNLCFVRKYCGNAVLIAVFHLWALLLDKRFLVCVEEIL